MITHYGRTFRIVIIDASKTRLYSAVCRARDIPTTNITHTPSKVTCPSCLRVLRAKKEGEIKLINIKLIENMHYETGRVEIAI